GQVFNVRYHTNMLLPGADSGFVVNIYTGNTAVFYYLKPANLIQTAMERKKDFLEAYKTVTQKNYREDKQSYDGETSYRYYSNYAETRSEEADLTFYIESDTEVGYQIYIRIKGAPLPKDIFAEQPNISTFYPETDLGAKIMTIYNAMLNDF